MRELMDQLFRRYGTEAVLLRGEQQYAVKAFFHSVNSRSWQNMEHVYSPVGETPRGQYNYIGAMEPVVEKGDLLDVGGRRYLLRRAEVVYDSKGPLYRWGLCVERGREDAWSDLN